MTKKIIFAFLSTSLLLTSCVSSKVYKDLEGRHANLEQENSRLSSDLQEMTASNARNEQDLENLRQQYDAAVAERDQLRSDLTTTTNNLKKLRASYDALEANSSSALAENSRRNRELLAELESREKALNEERARLERLQKELAARSRRVDELEGSIATQEEKMNSLKNSLSRALTNFEGRGLTVEQRDGKVYVSMENKLLFNSGSWAVGTEGRKAVEQLGQVLAENPDIAVLIEGHTDNVPYNGSGQLQDNWDLSTKRATSIVQILRENKGIEPQNLTAAGRGEHAPVASNETAEGKAKNRRIEVILTPKLDEVNRLLNEVQ